MKILELIKRKKVVVDKSTSLNVLFQHYMSKDFNELGVEFMVDVVNVFRPDDIDHFDPVVLDPLLELLDGNHYYREFFNEYIVHILKEKDLDLILTDAGILKDNDFIYEVRKRLMERLLPDQPDPSTMQYVLNQVFYSSTDPNWLQTIPVQQIKDLIKICGFKTIYANGKDAFVLTEILFAIEVLVNRVTGRAIESDVKKMVPELQNFKNPFITLQRDIAEFNGLLLQSSHRYVEPNNVMYLQLIEVHGQCKNYVDTAFKNSHKFGISLKVNQSLLRIRQQLDRIEELLRLITFESEIDARLKTIDFTMMLVRNNCYKSNVKQLIGESTQLISYEITQHTAQTGEHYITRTRAEYFKMFATACGGGLIVAFLCIFKLLLGKIDASDFGHAFYYSMNYSAGFIAIYLFGCTLATKQPAMTASALVSALENGSKADALGKSERYHNFAVFFARVFRSQFIAFTGNVLCSFPVALLLIWLIDLVFNVNLAEQKWFTLINDLSPVHSAAIFHAAIAGFFLFISGIIAGSISNRDKFNSVYNRIQEHPRLKKALGKERTMKLAKFYEKRYAGIISNFWFGIFMGSTMSIGIFLGLNLDIRHITFASGNLALGMYGAQFNITTAMLVWGIIGIGVIGLINFLVSFILSLSLAFRSRDIALVDLKIVAKAIWKHFKNKPSHFFFPPNSKNA